MFRNNRFVARVEDDVISAIQLYHDASKFLAYLRLDGPAQLADHKRVSSFQRQATIKKHQRLAGRCFFEGHTREALGRLIIRLIRAADCFDRASSIIARRVGTLER